MTKTICDVCGEEIPLDMRKSIKKNHNFTISSPGHLWDICEECRSELNKWMKERKEALNERKTESKEV